MCKVMSRVVLWNTQNRIKMIFIPQETINLLTSTILFTNYDHLPRSKCHISSLITNFYNKCFHFNTLNGKTYLYFLLYYLKLSNQIQSCDFESCNCTLGVQANKSISRMIVLHWLINPMINLIEEPRIQQLKDCTKVLPLGKKIQKGITTSIVSD